MKPLLQTCATLSMLALAAAAPAQLDTTALDGDLLAHKDAKWLWENDDIFTSAHLHLFENFIPHDENRTCSGDRHKMNFNQQVRGANLGGWLVLEPWITPTLFYQFLSTQERYGDLAPEKTAMDTYTFCTALGKDEANRQLRIHWASWVTEADLKEMAQAGVNSLRVPVGDWMFNPYEPYIGCTDGAVDELDRVANLALKYNIDLLLDIHGLIGSQNGFDNSGMSTSVQWTSIASTRPIGLTTFDHWSLRSAGWVGKFNSSSGTYESINYEHLRHSLDTVTAIVHRYATHPAIIGLEPANEPWELTPMEILKDYYWKSYKRVKARAPHWKVVFHDSFRFGVQYWSQFMRGCPDIALDTHIYQAWNAPGTRSDYFSGACEEKFRIAEVETSAMMPVIVGEWSLGTDNCAMWLNGFNDNLPGFPNIECRRTPCPVQSTYLGQDFPGTPLDVTSPIQGPYGTGQSGPSFGLCPITSNTSFGQQTNADELTFTRNLNLKKLNAFAVGHGWFFWNFKTEFGTRWNFLELVRQGAFPTNVSNYHTDSDVFTACLMEDKGEFTCTAKPGVEESDLQRGLDFACSGIDCSDISTRFDTFEKRCDWAFNEYWHAHREEGATCDFGGAAHLLAIPSRFTAVRHEVVAFYKTRAMLVWTLVGLVVGCSGLALALAIARHRRRQEYSPLMGRVVSHNV
ncbi:hypothetical protein PsorP6_012496 [Peronosclerospora sorghi]|uniref:Uncharacterized protein n=1 Tax=Peronosclerospora sorghi TaxID=230839 RepID=A0ACC0WI32_9STRA|nr:hypothetical protein PsorP6_012496 [Peronosclerospora sorghi]